MTAGQPITTAISATCLNAICAQERESLAVDGRRETVLIVATDPGRREELARIVEGAGWLPLLASAAREAVEVLFEAPPDLLLIDVAEPSGRELEVLDRYRVDADGVRVPVVCLLAGSSRKLTIEAFARQADDVITACEHPEELVARLRVRLERPPQPRTKLLEDPVTGALTSDAFAGQIRHELQRISRGGASGVLALLALDEMPIFEAHFGSRARDEVTAQVVRLLKMDGRKIDLVGLSRGLVGLLLPDTPRKGAQIRLERLSRLIYEHEFTFVGTAIRLTPVVGYTELAPDLELEEIEDRAWAAVAHEAGQLDLLRIEGSVSKAQNVNAALNHVRGEFVGLFDADHHPEPGSYKRAWRWIASGVGIVQGHCLVRNGSRNFVTRLVATEFEAIYAVSHPGRARLHGFGIFGGSNGYWRTSLLRRTRMRGFMLTEDIDSSMRVVKSGETIVSDPNLVSTELAPETIGALWNQRLRWAQGWSQVSHRHLASMVRTMPTARGRVGLMYLLGWREVYPWLAMQMVPLLSFWWVRGTPPVNWFVPVFLATSVFTLTAGPIQGWFAWRLAHSSIRQHRLRFVLFVLSSIVFYTEFKNVIGRTAHIKEAMRERKWKVTPRAPQPTGKSPRGSDMVPAAPGAEIGPLVVTEDCRRGISMADVPANERAEADLVGV